MVINLLSDLQINNIILDIVVILFAILMLIICARKGFINCFFGAISTVIALLVAITFAKSFVASTDGVFGLESIIQGKLEEAFAQIHGFDADVSKSGVEKALEEQNVSALLAGLVMKIVGKQDSIEAGTTLAMLLGEVTADFAITLIAGIILYIITKICLGFLSGVLNVFAENINLVNSTNIILGAVLGFLWAMLIVCAILAALAIFPNEGITEYLSKTLFVGKLYENNPLVTLLAMML